MFDVKGFLMTLWQMLYKLQLQSIVLVTKKQFCMCSMTHDDHFFYIFYNSLKSFLYFHNCFINSKVPRCDIDIASLSCTYSVHILPSVK